MIEALVEKKIINEHDIKVLVVQEDMSGLTESKRFIIQRLGVMFTNMIELVTDTDSFDYLSKLLLDLYKKGIEVSEFKTKADMVKYFTKYGDQLFSKLLVKALQD